MLKLNSFNKGSRFGGIAIRLKLKSNTDQGSTLLFVGKNFKCISLFHSTVQEIINSWTSSVFTIFCCSKMF